MANDNSHSQPDVPSCSAIFNICGVYFVTSSRLISDTKGRQPKEVAMAEEEEMKKHRPTKLWTPLITVESEDDNSAMPIVSTSVSSVKRKTFLPIPGQDEDGTSSGISDQCNSDVDSNFSPSPSGSYREADFMTTNSDSSTLHSDEDFIEEDLTPSPISPVSPKRSGSPSRSRNMLSPVSLFSARCYKLLSATK